MLYASSSWDLGRRLSYMYKSLKFLVQYFSVSYIVTEDYVIPKFRQAGITVIPTINNNLKMLIWEIEEATGKVIDLNEVSTTTWRMHLGIKSVIATDSSGKQIVGPRGKPKKDWKVPCREKVEKDLKLALPDTILANSNLKQRKLPHDVSDVLGISVAEALALGYKQVIASPDLFTNSETIHCIKILYTMR